MKTLFILVVPAMILGCAAPSAPAPTPSTTPAPSVTPVAPQPQPQESRPLVIVEPFSDTGGPGPKEAYGHLVTLLAASGKVRATDPAQVAAEANATGNTPRVRYVVSGTAMSAGMRMVNEGGVKFWVAECDLQVRLVDLRTGDIVDLDAKGKARLALEGRGAAMMPELSGPAAKDAVEKVLPGLLSKIE